MQLFSIGVAQLNMDGTSKLDEDGDTINTYTTNDIRSYARVWTGFMKQTMRGNVENKRHGIGNNDPMIMVRWVQRNLFNIAIFSEDVMRLIFYSF